MHANYIQREECTLSEALNALDQAVEDDLKNREKTDSKSKLDQQSEVMQNMDISSVSTKFE
jgi:hypothetical protein